MAKSITELVAAGTAIHPGEFLSDQLRIRKIKQKDFAVIIGISQPYLNLIIKGERGINTRVACLIGRALQSDPEYWLNLQRDYELSLLDKSKAFQDKLKDVDVRKWALP
jgi:addiction module HigA family antidote